jgi:uncharacterized repeat protein (TIGR03803 family)
MTASTIETARTLETTRKADQEKAHGSETSLNRLLRLPSAIIAAAAALLASFAMGAAPLAIAQAYGVIHSFSYTDGENPEASLIRNGNLYSTTMGGGSSGCGTVFKVDPAGNETVLYNFLCAPGDGAYPAAALVRDSAGNLYGTTSGGGAFGPGFGTVFKLDPAGHETVLHSFNFDGVDGAYPYAGLLMDPAGNLYGTTNGGGPSGYGTVFKLDPAGNETILYSFTGGSDGAFPYAGLIADSSHNLFGTTYGGGTSSNCNGGCGSVFKLDPSGTETVLHSFTGGSDGSVPYAGLIMDSSGNLYGTTSSYGATSGFGTVFKLLPSGAETVLYRFTGGNDGATPFASLVRDPSGNLFGTTYEGGASNVGTVFRVDPAGKETVLHSFTSTSTDGYKPFAGLVPGPSGNLYGTTEFGGSSSNCNGGCGTVFKLILPSPTM